MDARGSYGIEASGFGTRFLFGYARGDIVGRDATLGRGALTRFIKT